ncbi:hypothetical protein A7W90_12420 [Clostridium sp. Bc-iso-3]|nr:hypothetical protein A7W90_12420 [Clostridium sp. Bc-iso-3]
MNSKNNKISISKLSDDMVLRIIHEEFMRIKPKNYKEFYEKSCLPSIPTIQKRFGMKYSDVLIKAGIPVELLNTPKSNEYYIQILKQLAEKLGHTPSMSEMKREGQDPSIYVNRFGSYNKALKIAGLPINESNFIKKDIDKRKIIRDYKQLSERLGRPATQKDFNKYMPYSSTVVTSRFGSFVKLREEAGFPIDKRGTGRRVYYKEIILKRLVKDYIENFGPLSMKQLNQRPEYPSNSTLKRLFSTTKMSNIWKEVEKEARRIKGNWTNNRSQNKQIVDAGIRGERNVTHNLEFLDKNKFIVYNDIFVYDEDYKLSQQIDHLVIGPGGVISIETKSLKGEIIVRSNEKWEQYKNNNMYQIENPTQQVMRHEYILKRILPQGIPIKSIIVMGDYHTKVKNEEKCAYTIVNVNAILPFIDEHSSKAVLTEKQIQHVNKILIKHIIQNRQNTECVL